MAAPLHALARSRVAVDELLKAALAQVPAKGFTMAAVYEAAKRLAPAPSADAHAPLDRTLEQLFPGPDTAPTSAARRLFHTWDAMYSFPSLLEPPQAELPHVAVDAKAISMLSDRLAYSAAVKPHLLPAFVLLSSQPLPLALLLHPEWYAARAKLAFAYGAADVVQY
ncbi:hypothetical protein MSPP1_000765 [Malassezia sp. CBS 17886]|nr:hypothetical protein MSPP1_000765 [Malassezia sp. CBS 17886]